MSVELEERKAGSSKKEEPVLKPVKSAVGINGENLKRHVLLIQELINRNLHLLPNTYPLVEDGKDKGGNTSLPKCG